MLKTINTSLVPEAETSVENPRRLRGSHLQTFGHPMMGNRDWNPKNVGSMRTSLLKGS